MHLKLATSALLVVALGLNGCAAGLDEGDEDLPETLAQTVPGPPKSLAQTIDWRSAALQVEGAADPTSDFYRAQSIMSQLADNAYLSDEEFTAQAADFGFFTRRSLHQRNGGYGAATVDAFAGTTSDQRTMNFIAIKGTKEFGDWAQNLFAVPTVPLFGTTNGAAVHAGFERYAEIVVQYAREVAYSSCSHHIAEELRLPLWLTGHSQGGAVATLVAQRLAAEGCNVRGVSTFGSPRPGLQPFVDRYNGTILKDGVSLGAVTKRFTTEHDAVSCLAPGGAWKHVGQRALKPAEGGPISLGGQDECASFPAMEDSLRKTLAAAQAGADFPIEVKEWIENKIILQLLCRPGETWDDYVSLGFCTVTEWTIYLTQTLHIDPWEFFGTVVNLAFNIDVHKHYDFNANWDFGPPPPTATIRFEVFAGTGGAAPVIYDTISYDICYAELNASGNRYVCEFHPPIGARASYAVNVDGANALYGGGCGIETPTRLICDYDPVVGDDRTSLVPLI